MGRTSKVFVYGSVLATTLWTLWLGGTAGCWAKSMYHTVASGYCNKQAINLRVGDYPRLSGQEKKEKIDEYRTAKWHHKKKEAQWADYGVQVFDVPFKAVDKSIDYCNKLRWS